MIPLNEKYTLNANKNLYSIHFLEKPCIPKYSFKISCRYEKIEFGCTTSSSLIMGKSKFNTLFAPSWSSACIFSKCETILESSFNFGKFFTNGQSDTQASHEHLK